MFSRTDISERLMNYRERRISENKIMEEVYQIFSENEKTRLQIKEKLSENPVSSENELHLDLLKANRIYHISDIKKICLDYRLRFLDSKFFKAEIPEEAISEIRMLEKEHQTHLNNFKIVAPAKLLKLENADDPLLFTALGNDYYYLIHKWGKDLHPFRKLMMWPFKNMVNTVFTIFLISALITAITPMKIFTLSPGPAEYFFFFLYTFKAIIGLTVFYGVAKGKNFSGMNWKSKFYNG